MLCSLLILYDRASVGVIEISGKTMMPMEIRARINVEFLELIKAGAMEVRKGKWRKGT